MRLNLGCGKNILEGWVNADRAWHGILSDGVVDIDLEKRLPWKADVADEILLSHVIEHIPDTLGMMGELYRVAKPGCKLTIRCPYGSSDDAWEDPTHVRPYFLGSFAPFASTYYWRADYGYRGDWQAKQIMLAIRKKVAEEIGREPVLHFINRERNIVQEMIVELEAIKPAREAKKELQVQPKVSLMAV